MTADFDALRKRFPTLAERSYFAVQCLGPFPAEALADLDAYRTTLLRRNRGLESWIERMDEMTDLVARFLRVGRDDVMLRDTATAAHAAIAAAIHPDGARRKIVVSTADFHSTRYLWQGQAARGFEIVEVPGNGPEHADAATYLSAIDERTSIVALSFVSPRSGALLDVAAIAARAREVGAVFVLDAYQGVGIVPIYPKELGVHVLVGGNHKWLGGGGTGLAFAYVDPELAARLEPAYPGWIGHREMVGFAETFEPAVGARRFQQGTPPMEPIYTSRAGMLFALEVGVETLRERSLVLTERLYARALEHGLPVRTPRDPKKRGGMLVLDVPDPEGIVDRLSEVGFDVDERRGAGLRVGPHPCMGFAECDGLVERIAGLVRRV